jgi:ABC-2 type transport system ATP-binding protein
MIQVKNLVKHFGDKKAVDDISFNIKKGEILGFLGPNGAGKSTTMNMLTGYISSTSGTVLIDGDDILDDPIKAKSHIGYLPEIPPLYLDMTVKAYLNFIYDLKKAKLPRTSHIEEICKLTKILDVKERMIKNLSKGYKQRVGLAQALVGNPPVLILDEPTVGLDPKQIIEIRSLIKKLGKAHTIILSSHILQEIQAVCDRVIIINNGKIAADDTEDALSKRLSQDHRLVMRIEGDKNSVVKMLKSLSNVRQVRADIQREDNVFEYTIESKDDVDIRREVSRLCSEKSLPILMMKSASLTLEDIFLKITTGDFNFEPLSEKEKQEERDEKLQKKLAEVGFVGIETETLVSNEVDTTADAEDAAAAEDTTDTAEKLTDEKKTLDGKDDKIKKANNMVKDLSKKIRSEQEARFEEENSNKNNAAELKNSNGKKEAE